MHLVATSAVTDAAVAVAKDEESDIDPQTITSRRVGRVLRKLRLEQHREPRRGARGWIVTAAGIRDWAQRYGLPLPSIPDASPSAPGA